MASPSSAIRHAFTIYDSVFSDILYRNPSAKTYLSHWPLYDFFKSSHMRYSIRQVAYWMGGKVLVPHCHSVDYDGAVIGLLCLDSRLYFTIFILKIQYKIKYMIFKICLNHVMFIVNGISLFVICFLTKV